MGKKQRIKRFACICIFAMLLAGCGEKTEQNKDLTPMITSVEANTDSTDIITSTAIPEEDVSEGLQAPMLTELVKRKQLPTLEKRLPVAQDIMVETAESIGTYGGIVQFALMQAGEETGQLIEEGLFRFAPDGTIEPNVAKGYTVNEDFTEYTIYLRKGMRWSDGVLFQAEDCIFFYESMCVKKTFGEELWSCFLAKNPQTGKTSRAVFKEIDEYTFQVIFDYPNPDFLENLTKQGSWCFAPKHYHVNVLPEFMGEQAALSKAKAMGYADIAKMCEQTGRYFWNVPSVPTLNAYVLSNEEGKNDVTGNYYEFVRNPYYWKTDAEGKQLPYMDTLAYTRISALSQRLLLTVNGSLSVSEADVAERQTVEESAEIAGYTVVEWPVVQLTEQGVEKTDEVKLYTVDVNLKNFPTNAVYCTDFNGWNMARCHLWYISDVD